MAALVCTIFWLHFCSMGGSEDVSSILVYVNGLKLHPSSWKNWYHGSTVIGTNWLKISSGVCWWPHSVHQHGCPAHNIQILFRHILTILLYNGWCSVMCCYRSTLFTDMTFVAVHEPYLFQKGCRHLDLFYRTLNHWRLCSLLCVFEKFWF